MAATRHTRAFYLMCFLSRFSLSLSPSLALSSFLLRCLASAACLPKQEDEKWLQHELTLRAQGVQPHEALVLRKKFFFSDQDINRDDPVQVNLVYGQVRCCFVCLLFFLCVWFFFFFFVCVCVCVCALVTLCACALWFPLLLTHVHTRSHTHTHVHAHTLIHTRSLSLSSLSSLWLNWVPTMCSVQRLDCKRRAPLHARRGRAVCRHAGAH